MRLRRQKTISTCNDSFLNYEITLKKEKYIVFVAPCHQTGHGVFSITI